MRTYQVDIAGMKRDLQVFPINEKVAIAAFILFGDVEITEHSAKKLLEKVPEFDLILTPRQRQFRWHMKCQGSRAKNMLSHAKPPNFIWAIRFVSK